MERNSFAFQRSYAEAMARIRDREKRTRFLLAVINYGLNMELPEFDESDADLGNAWTFIQPALDRSHKKFLNGKKGGAPEGNKNAKKSAKEQI